MTDRLLVAAMALIWLALPATMCGQELQVTLGRIVVEVGMAESNVLKEAAAKKQRITTMPGDDRTAIVWDGEAVGKTAQSLGSIVFRAGKVNSIFKRSTPEQAQHDVDVGNALFGVASEFMRAGRTQCALATRTREEPGQQEQVVSISCGRRTIEVSTIRNDDYRIVETSVTEWVK